MKILYFLTHPLSLIRIIFFKIRLHLFKRLIHSKDAWLLFDQSKIAGFGTNLIRLYFPIYYDKKTTRDSFSAHTRLAMTQLLMTSLDGNPFDELIVSIIPQLLQLPLTDLGTGQPFLDNYYFGVMDAAVLSSIMQTYKPAKLIEIGSGVSTRYMKLFKDQFKLITEIVCIDPFPREVITQVADKIITEPLENVVSDFGLKANDILFLDGSHYVFQGNDTLTAFFTIFPSLPVGVVIHIHDIYLPYDYSSDAAPQLWAEQYLLAAMLIAGFKGYEVLYPAYYASLTNKAIISVLKNADDVLQSRDFQFRKNHTNGFSFWIIKTQ